MLARQLGYMLIGRRDAASPVDHDDRDVGFLQRLDGLIDHRLFDTFLPAGHAAGIDYEVGNRPELAETVLRSRVSPG